MTPVRNGRVLFNSVPEGYPVPGETTVYDTSLTIDPENVPLDGGFLVKTLVLSVDPYLRGMMRHPETESYLVRPESPLLLLCVLEGYGIGIVLRSETTGVEVGKYIYGPTIPHQEYTVFQVLGALRIIEKLPGLPWTAYVGAAGMPGKTAYAGWKEFSDAKPLRNVYHHPYILTRVDAPIPRMVIQLAKQAGMKVIASAGSEAKVQFMKALGADVVFNYKTTDTRVVLAKEGPVDVYVFILNINCNTARYWDNVGGETLDAALEFSALYGRFLECGMISGYNTGDQGIKNLGMVVGKSLHMHGILIFHLEAKYDKEFYQTIPPKLASGEFKHSEEVSKGLDKVGDVILAVQKGTNKAKAVVVVAEE
ncbi:chaperonin 10-like protein [Mycena epipterygia]|nr:chaperonin 10-like protein [Mycena epipterygia]